MTKFKLNKRLFIWIVISLVVLLVIAGCLLSFKEVGVIDYYDEQIKPYIEEHIQPHIDNLFRTVFSIQSDVENMFTEEEETGPWGSKTLSWLYDGKMRSVSVSISKEEYKRYQYGISGTLYPDNISAYVVKTGDVVQTAARIKQIIAEEGYTSDEDKVGLVLSLAESLPYQTDAETGHSAAYPRTPAVFIAEKTGDSGDHAIFAAAVLNELGYATALLYYPPMYIDEQTLIPEAVTLALVSEDDSEKPVYRISVENSTKTVPLSPFWTVDTSAKQVPVDAYYAFRPQIYPTDTLRTGEAYAPVQKSTLVTDFISSMELPNSTGVPTDNPRDWLQNATDYYVPQWYPSDVIWPESDANVKWQVYQNFLTIQGAEAPLYTPWGTQGGKVSFAWRLRYNITSMLDAKNDMTPYSDVRFSLYSVNESTGALTFVESFGWQWRYSASTKQIAGPFEPGEYVLGTFVRNAGVDISIEYRGRPDPTKYGGAI